MSYEKYTWQTGEVITADKLNHMEEGIKNSYITVFDAEFRESDTKLLVTAENGAIKVGDAFNIEWTQEMPNVTITGNTFGYCMQTDTGSNDNISGATFIYVDENSGTLKVALTAYDETAGGYLQYTVG